MLKLARETVTLDRLIRARLIVGLGTGGDIAREYSAFGEDGDARRLGHVLDDGTAVLTALWAGETVISQVAALHDRGPRLVQTSPGALPAR